MVTSEILRLHLGHFTAPPEDHRAGEKIFVVAYLIRHPHGLVLFDTGIAEGHPEAEELYRPVRRPLVGALGKAGASLQDIRAVANCHLHLDHSGGNHLFPGTPIFAQAREYEAAREPDYTLASAAADFPGATFELHDGEAEVLPGLRIVPTPGHVPGHQSLLVETGEGQVLLAGQAFNSASQYARAQYAWELERSGSGEDLSYPDWIPGVQELDPVRVLFAHDVAVWEREAAPVPSRPQRVPAVHEVAPPRARGSARGS
jgi:N-acyl homoserine lactone hydrolase